MNEIKGFGSFTTVEHHLATLSIDEQNELYLSGELDRMLDEAEQESKDRREYKKLMNFRRKRTGGLKGEAV